ncbi:hypothetical protein MVEN_00462000 [Mycena venus]|uniref:Uncharacterized protein n=1 Tax=Mycena venus TaxID=2733690 RepID=A0A8H7D874_9AGAR|nr:hypothetical protein MVEN_00462000 [Mycena venus]
MSPHCGSLLLYFRSWPLRSGSSTWFGLDLLLFKTRALPPAFDRFEFYSIPTRPLLSSGSPVVEFGNVLCSPVHESTCVRFIASVILYPEPIPVRFLGSKGSFVVVVLSWLCPLN